MSYEKNKKQKIIKMNQFVDENSSDFVKIDNCICETKQTPIYRLLARFDMDVNRCSLCITNDNDVLKQEWVTQWQWGDIKTLIIANPVKFYIVLDESMGMSPRTYMDRLYNNADAYLDSLLANGVCSMSLHYRVGYIINSLESMCTFCDLELRHFTAKRDIAKGYIMRTSQYYDEDVSILPSEIWRYIFKFLDF